MVEYGFLKPLEGFFEEEPPILASAKTIQVLVMRQTHDYTIFRTEETRELNVATIPRSIDDPEAVLKVVFLASKQKAPENRMYARLFKTYADMLGVQLDPEVKACRLKDNLCRKCPRCILFGAVATEAGGGQERWNIKHRVEYSSAYSIEPYEDISELITFNAVDPATQSTGQALGYTENVRPVAHFPSVVTLRSVTPEELIWYLKTLMATKSYGAETRVKGDVINSIVGIAAGLEELITSLEYSLEMAARDWADDPVKATYEILGKYQGLAAFPEEVRILTPQELTQLIDGVRSLKPTKEFIEKMRDDALSFAAKAEEYASGGRGGRGRRGRRR